MGMEIAQSHPGLESTAEYTHGHLGGLDMKLPVGLNPESPGWSENLDWRTEYVFSLFFFFFLLVSLFLWNHHSI